MAETVAREIGVDGFESNLLPEDKIETVERIVKRYNQVAMEATA